MKRRRIIFSLILLCLWGISIIQIIAIVTSNWGDVVNVRYTLFLDEDYTETYNEANTDAVLPYVYLAKGDTVPSSIINIYPKATTSYLEKFKEGLVGLQVSQTEYFMISAADGYPPDINNPLAGKNIYFKVTLLEILFDASEQGETTTTNTNIVRNLNFMEKFGAIIAIVTIVLLLFGVLIIRSVYSSRTMKSVITEEKKLSSIHEATIKKERSQLKELRELTEYYNSKTDKEASSKEKIKFHRRK